FWGLTILWLAPWMVFLPQSIRQVPLRLRQLRNPLTASQRASVFFFIWALVVVGFFTFSTRQEYYTLPAIPALALLLGAWLAKESSSPESEFGASKISSWVLFTVVVLGSIVGVALLLSSKPAPPGADLAALLKKNPQDYDLALGHFLDLTPEALGLFPPQFMSSVGCLLLHRGVAELIAHATSGPPLASHRANVQATPEEHHLQHLSPSHPA